MFTARWLLATILGLALLPQMPLLASAQDRVVEARGDGEDARLAPSNSRDRSLWDEPPRSPFGRTRGERPLAQSGPSEAPPLPSSQLVAPVYYEQNRVEEDGDQTADRQTADEPAPLRLSRRGGAARAPGDETVDEKRGDALGAVPGSWKTMAGALAVVLGLFFLLTMFAKKAQPRSAARLPTEVLESLGQVALPGKQQLQLVRLGDKLILLSMTPSGATNVGEISDPEEVERLTGLCRQNQPGSFTNTFRRALAQFGDEPAPGGFLGDEAPAGRVAGSRTQAGRAPAARSRR